ncbi:formate dehydrogenase family accessory protein FdhD [Deinococcus actinosclerus]|uniref:Sulfur carrier protein FdhD n=1 Tax=Deinococcus actinosclerus TaxID=1768108 RepID=A0ABM5X4X8_9DEIO|nr:formate dehydrogenase accessory sulfurtransferase FdhD [Deinococcus actinosclerus]ALW88715.1 formate dehydrogenase family accessory protein FdhD [Deinococcus actinosclerus]
MLWRGGAPAERVDAVAVEEPLELRLHTPDGPLPLGVLMRTPGHDRELLLGWLVSEDLLPDDLKLHPDAENPNVWHLHTPDFARLAAGARLAVSSSACGVCGSGSVERLMARASPPSWAGSPLDAAWLSDLPEVLVAAQPGFAATGGLHGAALFTPDGTRLAAFEDVGRHNAVDKLVGWAQARGRLPLSGAVLVVSSRAGFEIVQKAVTAGVAVVVAVGAATSLAVDTAAAFGVTLCGFARGDRLTVYAGGERLSAGSDEESPADA